MCGWAPEAAGCRPVKCYPIWPNANWNYSESDKLDDYWKGFYSGNCPYGKDNTCAGYTYYYEHDGPYPVTYEIKCINEDSLEQVPCSEAIYFPDGNESSKKTFAVSSDGVIRFTQDYTKVREHIDKIEVYD